MSSLLTKLVSDGKNRLKIIFNNDQKKAGLNWLRTRQLKYKGAGSIHKYNLKGHTIHFINGNELLHSLREIFVHEIYKMNIPVATPNILDCGANIGLSVIFFKQLFPEAAIIAFEPDEANFSLLRKNTAGLPGVTILQQAVWKENTVIEFEHSGTLSSKIATAGAANIVKINAVRLREFLRQQRVDFLKLDIEGAEYEVIKDCAEDIGKVPQLFIEYHGYFVNQHELHDMLSILARNGFSYYIKEATDVYPTPFVRQAPPNGYDIQLNIFCFKIS